MRRCMLGCTLLAGLGLFAMTTVASAQMGMSGQNNPYYRPAVSPYVNLARGGNAAANYYGIVVPQANFQRQIQTLQQQQGFMSQLGIANADEEDFTMGARSITGHPTMFFNYGNYFGQSSTTGNRQGTGPTQSIFGKKK